MHRRRQRPATTRDGRKRETASDQRWCGTNRPNKLGVMARGDADPHRRPIIIIPFPFQLSGQHATEYRTPQRGDKKKWHHRSLRVLGAPEKNPQPSWHMLRHFSATPRNLHPQVYQPSRSLHDGVQHRFYAATTRVANGNSPGPPVFITSVCTTPSFLRKISRR